VGPPSRAAKTRSTRPLRTISAIRTSRDALRACTESLHPRLHLRDHRQVLLALVAVERLREGVVAKKLLHRYQPLNTDPLPATWFRRLTWQQRAKEKTPPERGFSSGHTWDRTRDLPRVKRALSR
jgi:hypothetical protein